MDNGTTAYSGNIDNILIDDAEFPAGHPTVRNISIAGDDTLTNAEAYGTSVTTVANALNSSYNDAKQLRFTSATGKAVLTVTMPSTTGMEADVLRFQFCFNGASTRSARTLTTIQAGWDLSSVESFNENTVKSLRFTTSTSAPTSTNESSRILDFLFEKSGGGKYTTTDLTTMKLVLKAETL